MHDENISWVNLKASIDNGFPTENKGVQNRKKCKNTLFEIMNFSPFRYL